MLRERRMTSRERGEGMSVVVGRGLKYLGRTPRPRGGPGRAPSWEPHTRRPSGGLDPGLLLGPSAPAPSRRGGDPAGTSPGGGANLPSSSGRWFPEPFLSRRHGGQGVVLPRPRDGGGDAPPLYPCAPQPPPHEPPLLPAAPGPGSDRQEGHAGRRPARLSPTALRKLPAGLRGGPPGC